MTLRATVNHVGQYVTTQGALPDIVTRIDRNLRFLYVSPTIERTTGLPPEHFIGKTHAEAGIPEPVSSGLEEKLRQIFKSGRDVSVHFGFPDEHGQMRHYRGVGVPETDETGEVKTILTVMRDITEERRAEETQRIVEQQLRLLVEASTALLKSPHSQDVLRTIIVLAQRFVAADGHSVWGRDEAGDWHILSAAGLSEEYLKGSLPASTSQEMRGPIVASDVAAEPLLSFRREAYAREGIRSLLAIPLAIHNEPNGTVVFYWREPHQISNAETRIAQALGNLAAAALGTSRLYEREIQARERAQRSEQRSAFLAEAGALLNSSLDYEITLRNVAHLAVPKFADWCSVEIVDDKGRVQRVALHHTNPEMILLAAEYREKFPPNENDLSRVVTRTGKATAIERLPPEVLVQSARSPEHLDYLLKLGIASLIVVPICINTESLGAVTFVRSDPDNAYSQEDLQVAEEVGRRAGNAIAHSRLYRDVQASEERLRLAVAAAGLGVWERAIDSHEITASPQNKLNLGVDPDQPLTFEDLKGRIHKDDLEAWQHATEKVQREGGSFESEYRIWYPDGSLHTVLAYGRALDTELGRSRKLVGITIDVTERRLLLAREQEARRTAELLNSVGPVLLSQLEVKTLVPDMTEIAATLVGAEFGALVYGFKRERSLAPGQSRRDAEIGLSRAGTRLAEEEPAFGEWLRSLPPDIAADCLKPGTAAARVAEFPCAPHPPPSVRLRSFLLAPVRSRGGDVLGSLVLGHRAADAFHERHERIAMGISAQAAIALDNARLFEESRFAREAMEQSNAELRRVNEDLNQFAYSASHDLQEPLRMVAIYSQMLQRRYSDVLDERGKQYLSYATQGAKRMEMLVKDLLAYTQAASSPDVNVPLTDTTKVVHEVLSNLQTCIEESRSLIDVSDLPPLRINAFHLLQILQNLIGNAIKYRNPSGLPRIAIYGARDGEIATITVQDNGIGVAEEYRKHIFGLFRRLHSWDKYSGTGIGLAICQRLVERYGGKIWVDAPENGGSAFRFTLPAIGRAGAAGLPTAP